MFKDDVKFTGFGVTVSITMIWLIMSFSGLNMYYFVLKKTPAVSSQSLVILCHNTRPQVTNSITITKLSFILNITELTFTLNKDQNY